MSYRWLCIGKTLLKEFVTVAPVIDCTSHNDGFIILIQARHTAQPSHIGVSVKIKELLDKIPSLN